MLSIPGALTQAVVVPIVMAPIVYLASKRMGIKCGWLAFATLLYSTVLLITVAMNYTIKFRTYGGGI